MVSKTNKQTRGLIQSFKEVESWDFDKKNDYYQTLRTECIKRNKKANGGSRLISRIAPFLRNFEIEIRGEKNIPEDSEVIFAANHSNSHDVFVIKEIFSKINKQVALLVAWDGLNLISRLAFYLSNGTFIDRNDKESIEEGFINFCSKVVNGNNGLIWGEATWNLHPILPMQKVKAGVVQASLIAGKPIVPIIMEYVESPKLCNMEKELYSKCVVKFGEPIYPPMEANIFVQAEVIQQKMESMRRELWEEFGITRKSIDDIDKELYLNHLHLKKFKTFGFKYDSEQESKFLLNDENEYCINSAGDFAPGILKESLTKNDFTNKQGLLGLIKDNLSGARLQRLKREKRWNDYLTDAPISDIERVKKRHSFVLKVLKIDLFFVGQKQRILHDRRTRRDVPTIFACTHIGRYDAEQLLVAIEQQAHVFFGDPGNIYRSVNGLLLHFNGVIYVETNNKNDRIASKSAINKLINQGGSLLIFPEGAWNITENLPAMRIYSGAIKTAIKTGCDIVPIAMEEYDNTYVINIGENISFRERSVEDKNVLSDELRDVLCTLRWEIWEDKGIVSRESLRPNEAEIYVQSIMKRTTNGYTVEKINKRKYQDNHNQY